MSGMLGTSTSALLAFQRALATTSHNVANVNTDGYSRQRVELSNRAGAPNGAGFAGAGVQVDTVRRLTDEFLTSRLLDSGAELGRFDQLSLLASRLDATFTDPGTSLSQPWSSFFDSAQAVATDPASTSARESYLASAETLAARFRYLDRQLDALEIESNQRLEAAATEATRLAQVIGRLNADVIRQRAAAGGQPPNDLLDQRDKLISDLNRLVGVTTVEQEDGALNVFTTGGQALVVGTQSLQLLAVQDPFQPQRLSIAVGTLGGSVRLPDSSLAGELRGLIDFRTQVLDPTNRQLGLLAVGVTQLANETNALGVDLYGDAGQPIFNAPQATVFNGLGNTGGANLTVQYVDLAQIASNDIELSFDGGGWSARDPLTGAVLPLSGDGSAGDPFLINGLAIEVQGGVAAGDSFLIQPSAGVAGRVQRIMDDPRRVAAASPVRSSAALSNLGDAVPQISVLDRNDPNLGVAVDIQFLDPTSYSIDGGGAIAWAPGDPIDLNGWRLQLDGLPETGDLFSIRATLANSSDNTNARALAQLDDTQRFFGNISSLNTMLRESITAIGASARQAESSLEAQDAIQQQLVQERQSASGVNLDEEASNMLRFQQAYQAAAKMISTADTIFQSLLAAVRA